ncbi:hypothetical protein C8Q74DRAFT_1370866 [Fomes fomentarius]|nr:hypothetical protein C8Q74DRAFT_1370866 [Fomes fomentarius]
MAHLSLDNTVGAAFLGVVATSCFYGITVVQTYIYFRRYYESDPKYLKSLVFLLWVLDSLHLALIIHAVYFYVVTNFTNVLGLMIINWSILAQIVVTGVSDLIVRGVFCHRVWRLSNMNWLLVVAIVISSLVVFSGSIAFAVKGFSLPSFTALSEISDILYVSLGSGVVADIFIAASLCFLLAKRRTGFQRTDSTVRVLMLYSINTGALTSLCALLCLLTYANMPDNFIFIAFYFVLPKLFLNSLLATLNARRALRETNSTALVSIPLSTTQNSHMSFTGRPQFTRSSSVRDDQPRSLAIQVRTETDTKTDVDPHVGTPTEGFSDGIVRGILCYRIWILSDKNVLLVVTLAASSLLAFAFPIVGFQYTTFFELEHESWILYLGLSTVVLSDFLMTATLCLLLSTRRSNIAMVNGVIRNLILYSINTCALTTLCSLAALVAYAASPHTFIYIAFYFLLPKLLLNSLLAVLNARKSFREQIGRGGVHLTPSSVMHSRDATSTRNVDVDRRRISLYPMPLRSASYILHPHAR